MPGKKPQEIIKEAGGLEKYYDKYDEVFDKDRGQAFYLLETTVKSRNQPYIQNF